MRTPSKRRHVTVAVALSSALLAVFGQWSTAAAQPPKAFGAATPVSPDTQTPTDCPYGLDCWWVPAPHVQYGEGAGDFGNYDLANRSSDMPIRYIVIHSTLHHWKDDLHEVQNPRKGSWNFTVRSYDSAVVEHVSPRDVAHHAGNRWFNMHSIGIRVEEQTSPAQNWVTQSAYAVTARLVQHLAAVYDIPLDRAHIIGEDEVPGGTPATASTMPTDPGPAWD